METAIIYVLNDLLLALDSNDIVFVTSLDCSATFDLVDHQILLQGLSNQLVITGAAHDWFCLYLSARSQTVSIMGEKSQPHTLKCGVPQDSALGPKLFTIYTLPIGNIIRKHNAKFHLYADDMQLYITCQCPHDTIALKETIEIGSLQR